MSRPPLLNRHVTKTKIEMMEVSATLKEIIPPQNIFKTVLLGYAGKSLAGLDSAVFSTDLDMDTIRVKEGPQKVIFSWKSDTGVVIEKASKKVRL